MAFVLQFAVFTATRHDPTDCIAIVAATGSAPCSHRIGPNAISTCQLGLCKAPATKR